MTPLDSEAPITQEDWAATAWRSIASHEDLGSFDLSIAFESEADAAERQGEVRSARCLRLLALVCSFRLARGQGRHPFRAGRGVGGLPPTDAQSVPAADVESLVPLLGEVPGAVLRARLADFIWTRRGGAPVGTMAAETYLVLTGALSGEGAERNRELTYAERALDISRRLGLESSLRAQAVALVRTAIDRIPPQESSGRHADLLRLAVAHQVGEPSSLFARAKTVAQAAQQGGDWSTAERFWLLAEDLARAAGSLDLRTEAVLSLVSCYEAHANADVNRAHIGPLQAAGHLERAIEALRRVGGFQERVSSLHRQLMDHQSRFTNPLPPLTIRIPIDEPAAAARTLVQGRPLHEAMVQLALLPLVPPVAVIRAESERTVDQHLLRTMFPVRQMNRRHRTVGREDALNDDPERGAAAVWVEMVHSLIDRTGFLAGAIIDPARRTILEEHSPAMEDFVWAVSNNPWVPQGREQLFAMAFRAGFDGDLVTAVHLLVHQMENSIREILRAAGADVTTFTRDGTQTEKNLNALLVDPRLNELLGEDALFALRALLIDKVGPDLRNGVAHGLLDADEFYTAPCLFLWWLCFRLVSLPASPRVIGTPEVEQTRDESPT